MSSIDTGLHYPIKLDGLPKSWAYGVVGEFCDVVQSGFACGKHSDDDIGVTHLRPMNVSRKGAIDLTVQKFVPSSYDDRRLSAGNVLFNNTNSPELIGKTAYVTNEAVGLAFSNHMTRIKFNSAVDAKYGAYQLHYLWMARYYMHKCIKHVNQASISSRDFSKSIPFVVPPTNEQHRIVAKIEGLFSELDKGIESLRTARKQLKIYRQALLKYAFEGKLTEQWRKENADKLESADQLLERIKREREARYQQQLEEWKAAVKQWEADGKEGKKPSKPSKLVPFSIHSAIDKGRLPTLPNGWEWLNLSDVVERIQIGPFGSLLHKQDYIQGGTPLINPSHIKDMSIVPDYGLTVSDQKLSELEKYVMSKNDIVIGRRGEMGRCAIVKEQEDGWLCGTGSLFVRLLRLYIADFYCHILSSQRVRDYLSDSSIGTTMQNLNQKILQTVPIPICSYDEQIEIVSELNRQFSVIDNTLQDIDGNLKKSKALRQSILKKAFSGQLVPQDPNDEPASELLKRIATEKSEQAAQAKATKAIRATARKKRAAKIT